MIWKDYNMITSKQTKKHVSHVHVSQFIDYVHVFMCLILLDFDNFGCHYTYAQQQMV